MKRIRESKNLSQHELAVALGLKSSTAVSQWERNIYTPRRPMLARIDQVLGDDGAVLRAYGITMGENASLTDIARDVDLIRAEIAELRRLIEGRPPPGEGS